MYAYISSSSAIDTSGSLERLQSIRSDSVAVGGALEIPPELGRQVGGALLLDFERLPHLG